ncbi:MAG: hypothetical protein ABSH16_07360 [Sedimentisphaerales bacterium]
MASKEEVRPIYAELQGYLAQELKTGSATYDSSFWERPNSAITELVKVTGKDYSRFMLTPKNTTSGSLLMAYDTYRQQLGGIIARLHAEYFSDETPPFADMPKTIITQSQNQNQSLQVQLLLELNDLIHEKMGKVKDGSKEKTFLEKIKASLSSVRDVSQLVSLLVMTAQQVGLTIEQLKTLFS